MLTIGLEVVLLFLSQKHLNAATDLCDGVTWPGTSTSQAWANDTEQQSERPACVTRPAPCLLLVASCTACLRFALIKALWWAAASPLSLSLLSASPITTLKDLVFFLYWSSSAGWLNPTHLSKKKNHHPNHTQHYHHRHSRQDKTKTEGRKKNLKENMFWMQNWEMLQRKKV